MFRLLSDLEVALNELLVACRETQDHFRDATQLTDVEEVADDFAKIARERESFIRRLEEKIRELGDLPSMPDPDKEDGEMLIHHIGAAVSEDYTGKLLHQRIDAEKNIAELINKAKANDENNSCQTLLNDLDTQVKMTIEKLSQLGVQP